MIEIIEGVGVGAGKSFYVCTRIARHIARGGTVCVSDKFGIQWERPYGPHSQTVAKSREKFLGGYHPKVEGLREFIEDEYGVVPLPEQYLEFSAADVQRAHEVTPMGTEDCPVLMIVDEAQDGLGVDVIGDVDLKEDKKRTKAFWLWLAQSRHDDNDVLFITQHAANINVKIRRLSTFVVRIRNMTQWSIGGLKTTWWRKFCVNVEDAKATGKNVARLERIWLAHDPRIFSSYISKSQKGAHKRTGVVTRKQLQRVQSKPVSKAMKFLLLFLVVALCGAGYLVFRLSTGENLLTPNTAQHATAPVRSASVATDKATPAKPAYKLKTETFRGGDMRTFLHTDADQYYAGQMSSSGMVEAVQGSVAKVLTPENELLYIVGKNGVPPVSNIVSTSLSPATVQGNALSSNGAASKPDNIVTQNVQLSPQRRALAGLGTSDDELRKVRERAGGYPSTDADTPAVPSPVAAVNPASLRQNVPPIPLRPL